MNEEEIIDYLKEIIQEIEYRHKDGELILVNDTTTDKLYYSIKGLLDLYNKEIQRNKDLEQIEKEHKEENGRLREKIKELEEECKKVVIAPEGTCFLLKEKDIIPKLKAKLERDIEIYSREGCCRKQVREGIVREAKEILELLEESEK